MSIFHRKSTLMLLHKDKVFWIGILFNLKKTRIHTRMMGKYFGTIPQSKTDNQVGHISYPSPTNPTQVIHQIGAPCSLWNKDYGQSNLWWSSWGIWCTKITLRKTINLIFPSLKITSLKHLWYLIEVGDVNKETVREVIRPTTKK